LEVFEEVGVSEVPGFERLEGCGEASEDGGGEESAAVGGEEVGEG
jgi:hypothetical protein